MVFSWFSMALALAVAGGLLAFVPLDTFAWGKAGHRVVATPATRQLTPEARTQVTDLLGPGVTLAQIATWADEVRSSRPSTGPWHYVNLPRVAADYDATRDCRRGCVVSANEQSLRLLRDTSKEHTVRADVLREVVHFAAGLHQPLHVVAEDRGGNDVLVQFMGRQTNLHRLWDGKLIDHAYPSATALYKPVRAVLQTATRQAWAEGRPADWAMETHRVARGPCICFPRVR